MLPCYLLCADVTLKPEDCPLARGSSSHFEVKRIAQDTLPFHPLRKSSASSRSPSLDVSNGMNGSNGFRDLSNAELLTGKLKLHGELIKALQDFAAHSTVEGLFETSGAMSRETVLEQALVEQNQILDVMQELIATLESENKERRGKVNKQGRIISGLEVKLRQDEKALAELRSKSHALSMTGDTSQISELKRQLRSKEQAIASLQSKLSHDSESMLSAKLTSAKTRLEVERVHCIELEEELSRTKSTLSKLNRELGDKNTKVLHMESEVAHLTHEMESMRQFEQQQQDLIAKHRSTLSSKDVQVRSLTRALNKEKKVADQLRRIQVGTSGLSPSSKAGDSANSDSQHGSPSLFEQLAGRATFSAELTRITPESELGFSFAKVGSGKSQGLVVKHVIEASLADGVLSAGDELLEVNGLQCCCFQQSRAVNALEKGVGILKLVVARASDYPSMTNKIFHSTPNKFADAQGTAEASSIWATALHSPNATFQNFSVETSTVNEFQAADAKFVTVPESFALSTTPNTSSDQVMDVSDSGEKLSHHSSEDKPLPGTPVSASSVNESGSLITLSSREEVSIKKLQYEVADLQDQLDESERLRLEFESALDTTREELNRTKTDSEAFHSENAELSQLLLSRDNEISDIQRYISELQSSLVALQSGVVDDQQKIGSLENQNKILSAELVETRSNSDDETQTKEILRGTVKSLTSELKKTKKESTELDLDVQELNLEKAQLTSAAAGMENELRALRDSLEASKNESEATLSAVNQECHELRSRLEEVTEVSDKTKAFSQEQYDHLTSQLKFTKTLLEETEMKDGQVQIELTYHKQAADQANKLLEKVEMEYHKTVDELHYYRQEAERKTLEMESMTIGLKGIQSKLEGKQLMTARLQTEVDTLRRTNAKLRNEAFQLKEMVKETELNLRASKAEEIQLGEKLRASSEEKNDLFIQLEKSFEESTELTMTVDRLQAELDKLKEQDMVNSKTAIEELVQSSNLAKVRLQGELESSRKKVEILTGQMSELKNKLKTSQGSADIITADLKQERSEKLHLLASKEELTKELGEVHENNSNLYFELDSKQQELEEASSALAQLKEHMRIEKEHATSYMAKISELESKLEQVKSGKNKAEGMITSLEFIQKQQEEQLEQANKAVLEKEKGVRQRNEQIEEINVKLQKCTMENTALATSIASMKQQLNESRRIHDEALKSLQDELSSKDKKLTMVSDDLKSQRSKEEILNAKIEYLVESLERTVKEKRLLEDSTEESMKCFGDLQSHDKQLSTQIDRLKGELSSAVEANDLLSSESASLRQQVRQNEMEIDQLLAQLHAAEINLEVSHRTISEGEKRISSLEQRLQTLESQYKSACNNQQELSVQLSTSSLELCQRDEEISKLKTTLDLCQQNSVALESSLVAVQSDLEESRKQVDELNIEHEQLLSTILNIEGDKERCDNAIKDLEKAISDLKELKDQEMESYQTQISSLKETESVLNKEIEELKGENQELEKAKDELMSAQEELKVSLGKIGDEKDIEIVKLQDEVRVTSQKVGKVEEDRDMLGQSEQTLKTDVLELENNIAQLEDQLKDEKSNNTTLRDEIAVHQATSLEIQMLNEKVSLLNDSMKEKSKHLIELEDSLSTSEGKVKEVHDENEALLEKVSELVTLKHTVADQAEMITDFKKKLEKKETDYQQVLMERDKFLSMVRELEVKHHQKVPSPAPAPIQPCTGSEDITKLKQLLEEREDEVLRTRQYTEELLINIMMKAPSLLEK